LLQDGFYLIIQKLR